MTRGKLNGRVEWINGYPYYLCASEFVRKARKEYICIECGKKIKKGETYIYCIMGDLPPIQYCLKCAKKWSKK